MTSEKAPSRPYRLRRRAESIEATRRRIAKAAFELHGLVGPAQTTIAGIAERAGVERATVYRHFPDDLSLFRACIGHGMGRHPFPDPATWRSVADPAERLRIGLAELYGFYRRTKYIWPNVLRDLPRLPLFQQANAEAGVFAYFDEARDAFAKGWRIQRRNGSRKRALLKAAIGHAVEFQTWHSLTGAHGLTDAEAVEVMRASVRCLAD
jgi:AcrR family transcriptional regulator